MSFNILRVQFTHSIRTFGIRCLPSFRNKSTLITTKPFITANTRLVTSLSNNNNYNKTLFRKQYNTSTRSRGSSRSIVEREKAKGRGELTMGQKGIYMLGIEKLILFFFFY